MCEAIVAAAYPVLVAHTQARLQQRAPTSDLGSWDLATRASTSRSREVSWGSDVVRRRSMSAVSSEVATGRGRLAEPAAVGR